MENKELHDVYAVKNENAVASMYNPFSVVDLESVQDVNVGLLNAK